MPHASFCLRDKGHFSKRNIRSLFLVLILRTACHNAFTFCPYIWICNPSCAFEEGMQTLFFNFSEAVGRCLQPAARRGRTLHARPCQLLLRPTTSRPSGSFWRGWAGHVSHQLGKGSSLALFSSCPISFPSQPASQPIKANCQTPADSGTVSTPAFPTTFLPPVSFSLWTMPEIALSLPISALGSTLKMLAPLETLCLRLVWFPPPLFMVLDEHEAGDGDPMQPQQG